MTLDFLPPQAYTKETLLKAYNWLQSQSDQVKELATTPDQLVSLYLKSSRLGQEPLRQETLQRYSQQPSAPPSNPTAEIPESTDRPSLQSFKSELKNLAGMMGDLDRPAQTPPTQAAVGSPSSHHQQQAPSKVVASNPSSTKGHGSVHYDEMTQNMIREVKSELNLSSDTEALRMLVKIGYQKVRSLYK